MTKPRAETSNIERPTLNVQRRTHTRSTRDFDVQCSVFDVRRSLLFFLLLAFPSLAADTNAVYALADLTVRAAPGESRLPDASVSATALDATAIADSASPHFQNLIGQVPNLTWAGGTSRPRYFQIRGIGERSQFAGEGPPNFSVGYIEDDMDLSGIGMHASLFDVDEVDVLRGPQAAVFGSKALAGLVDVRTHDPSSTPEARAQFTAGTDDLLGFGAAAGGPISTDPEVLSARLSVEHTYMNGFRDNVFLNRDDTNERDEWTMRGKLRWQPHPELLWNLTTLWSEYDNGYDEFTPDNNEQLNTYSDQPGHDRQETGGASLRGTWLGPDRYRLLSISSFTDTDSEYSYDADWANDAFWAAAPYFFDPAAEGYRYSFTETLLRSRQNASQDFRIISEPGGEILGGSSAWHLGAYGSWLGEQDDYTGFSALNSDYDAVSGAGYGQLSTRLADATVLRSALRIEERATDYSDAQGVRFDGRDTMWGGRLALEQKLDETSLVFAGISRGFKGSGVNQDPALPPEQRKYDPETLWNFETGARTALFEGWTECALTLFYMIRDDLQIGTSYQADPADPSSFVYFTDNAAEGYNAGAELEATQKLAEGWELFAMLALLETEYQDYQSAGGASRLDGREQPYAPNYSFNAGMQWHGTRGFFSRAEIQGKDGFYLSDEHDAQSDPYELVNLSAGYGRHNWKLTLWGRNVFDERYVTRGYVFGLEPPEFNDTRYVTYGDPAQFGATWDLLF